MLTGAPPVFRPPVCAHPQVAYTFELEPGSYSVVKWSASDLALSLSCIGNPPGVAVGAVLPGTTAGLELPAGSIGDP